MSRGGIVTSRRHIGRASFYFLFSFFYFLFLGHSLAPTVLLGLATEQLRVFLAVADSIDIFSARWGYVFSLLLMFLPDIFARTPRVL